VRCDGCGKPIDAAIRFIAPQAEFTPPVIYSLQNRANLVFLVEAWPRAPSAALHPGLPVDVMLANK
jgi:HlyD family secretion protein